MRWAFLFRLILYQKEAAKRKEREFEDKQTELQRVNSNLNNAITNLTTNVKEYVVADSRRLIEHSLHTQLSQKEKEFLSAQHQFARDSENYRDTIRRQLPVFDDTKV